MIRAPAGLALAFALAVATTPARAAEPLTLRTAVELAVTGTPELAALALEADAARAAAVPAAALPDPKLFAGVDNFPVTGPPAFTMNGAEMTMLTVGVMQDVPNRAKRRARAARAQAEIGVAAADLALGRQQVRAETAAAWIDLYYAERRLAALEALDQEIQLLADTAPPRIASGSASPAEAVDPGLAAAALANRRTELRSGVAKARADLARWIGAAAERPLAGPPPTLRFDAAQLRAGLDEHPLLRAYEPAIARAEAEARERTAEKRPDWSYEAAFHARDPDYGQMVSARVTIDLPLFASRRQDPRIRAAELRANRVRIERQAARRELTAELEKDLADHAAFVEALGRARETIMPLARRRADLQTASYRAGAVAFDAVLADRREAVEAELKILDLEAQAARAAARLAFYFGSDVR